MGHVGAIWADLGAVLGALGAILGDLEAILGLSGGVLGALGAILDAIDDDKMFLAIPSSEKGPNPHTQSHGRKRQQAGSGGRGVAPTGTLPPVSTKDLEEIDQITLKDSKHELR